MLQEITWLGWAWTTNLVTQGHQDKIEVEYLSWNVTQSLRTVSAYDHMWVMLLQREEKKLSEELE